MKNVWLSVCFFLGMIPCVPAQTISYVPFAKHLVQKKKYDDAVVVLNKALSESPGSKAYSDSLHYYLAYCFFKLEQPDSAKKHFSFLVHSENRSLKENSISITNHLRVHQLDSVVPIDSSATAYAKEINRVQTLAYLLLIRNPKGFKQEFDKEKCKSTDLAAIEFNLLLCYYDLSRLRNKSRFLAGTLSAILPGLGKWYAGKKHEALVAALPVIINGAQAYEGYHDKQLKSPHLYVFGSIGMVFYLSNIYGSARSAKVNNEEKHEQIRIRIFNSIDSIAAKF